MVELQLRIGPKGQVVIPKFIREKLGIEPGGHVVVELRGSELVIRRGTNVTELLKWLEETRVPVASRVSRFSLEDETIEAIP